jgi:hypothetical protein
MDRSVDDLVSKPIAPTENRKRTNRLNESIEPLLVAFNRKRLFDAIFEAELARKPAERGDVMLVAGCLFRAAGFLTLVLYAMNRRYWINPLAGRDPRTSFRGIP